MPPSIPPNIGVPLALAWSTWPDVPAAVTLKAPVVLPNKIPFVVNVPRPVPPSPTAMFAVNPETVPPTIFATKLAIV